MPKIHINLYKKRHIFPVIFSIIYHLKYQINSGKTIITKSHNSALYKNLYIGVIQD